MRLVCAIVLITLSVVASTATAAYSLSPYWILETGSYAENVAIGDIDGDGRNDVVLTTTSFYSDPANDYKVFVFLQQADGTLAPPRKYSYRAYAVGGRVSLALADLDNDGRMEIVVGHETGITILGWDSNPYRAYKMRVALHQSQWSLDAAHISTVDVDRDGALDVVALGNNGGAAVYFGNGHGGVSRQAVTETIAAGFSNMEYGDFNSDGYDDIALTTGGPPAYVYYNDGSDDFGAHLELDPSPDFDESSETLVAGDFNSDGHDDLVVMRSRSQLSLFLQDIDDGFQPLVVLETHTWPVAMVGHDLDLDGYDDLIVQHPNGKLGLYLSNAGELSTEVLIAAPVLGWSNSQALAAGDINGDGCTDIVQVADFSGLVFNFGDGCNSLEDYKAERLR